MNRQRRSELKKINDCLTSLLSSLESVKDDEEFAFDSMPENLQFSERGEESQDAISNMDDASDKLSQAIDLISEVIDSIEEVI